MLFQIDYRTQKDTGAEEELPQPDSPLKRASVSGSSGALKYSIEDIVKVPVAKPKSRVGL